jgi:hypothetical protein
MQVIGVLLAAATLWALPVSFLGCAYLLLAAIAVARPNHRLPCRSSSSSSTTTTLASRRPVFIARHVESVTLAILFTLHAASQYALMAALFPVKQSTCRFLESAVGLQCGSPRCDNLLSLGVPVALSACLACYRCVQIFCRRRSIHHCWPVLARYLLLRTCALEVCRAHSRVDVSCLLVYSVHTRGGALRGIIGISTLTNLKRTVALL